MTYRNIITVITENKCILREVPVR